MVQLGGHKTSNQRNNQIVFLVEFMLHNIGKFTESVAALWVASKITCGHRADVRT